ncbi:phage minor head protein [Halomonas eurihalina]|nr:phage minor head protein [Halomonas eurihalina]MDR5859413.1 phage minor head protein [Halomonas eurihalina]
MPGQPIVPRSTNSPAQTTRQLKAARRSIRESLRVVRDGVIERIQHDMRMMLGNRSDRYRYLLDQGQLDAINDYIAGLIAQEVMRGNQGDPIIVQQSVTAYEAATAAAVTNITTQSEQAFRNVEQTLMSEPYRRRIGYVRSRVFEEMQGFTDQTRTDLARVLSEGMARGESPTEIAGRIRDRVGAAMSRAEKIARTEINTGHRRAIWDQDEQANADGINTRLLHSSALIAGRTRETHARRHGRVYTRQEVEDWYSRDGNGINCLCTQTSVLVDANGRPLSSRLPKKMQKRGQSFRAEAYGHA